MSYFQDSAYEYYRMGCERGHPRACLHAGVMDTFEPGVPITLTGKQGFQLSLSILSLLQPSSLESHQVLNKFDFYHYWDLSLAVILKHIG
jgi:hypothetical protein